MTSRKLIHKKHLTNTNASMNYNPSTFTKSRPTNFQPNKQQDPPSNTDFLLFQALANPEQVQLDKMDPNEYKKSPSTIKGPLTTTTTTTSNNSYIPNSYSNSFSNNDSNLFSNYVKNRTNLKPNINNYQKYYGGNEEDSFKMGIDSGSSSDNNNSDNEEDQSGDEYDNSDDDENNYFHNAKKSSFNPHIPNSTSFSFSRSSGGRPSYNDSSSNMVSAQELCLLRNELLNYKRNGRIIDFDIETAPEYLLRTTLDFIREEESSEVMIRNLRDGLQVAQYGIEWANNKINSPIPLNGWTDNTNPHIYDHSLKRIYNLYFRNSQSHPLFELGTTMFMSGTSYSAKNVFGFIGKKGDKNNTPYVQQPQYYAPSAAASSSMMDPMNSRSSVPPFQPPPPPVNPTMFSKAPLNTVFENTKSKQQTTGPQLIRPPNLTKTTTQQKGGNSAGRVGMRPPFTSSTQNNNNNNNNRGGEPVSVIPFF